MISLKDGLRFHAHAVKSGFTPTIFSCNQLIHLYSKHGHLKDARRLFDEMPERNVFTWNAIISGHVRTQHLAEARALFDAAPRRDSVTYNSMLSGYVNCDGYETSALKLFLEMQSGRDKANVDEFTLTTMLNLTAKLCDLSYGRQLHSLMVKTANNLSGFSVSALIDMYSKCGCFQEAREAFSGAGDVVVDLVAKNAMVATCCREGNIEAAQNHFWSKPELNDSVTWNTLISGYAQNGYEEQAIEMFGFMAVNGFKWNEHTFASVLSACSALKRLNLGKEIHAWVLKKQLISNPFISSGIVDVYCKCGNMKYAKYVDSRSGIKNIFSITSLIVGYSSQGNMVEARKFFDTLTDKNHVVWTAMFSGYVKSKQCEEVFELLNEFISEESIVLDPLILVSVLGACGIRATVDHGKQTHGCLLRNGIKMDEKMNGAIVDMYSKCGNITYAEKFFQRVLDKDLVLYNVMLAGFANHGYEYNAFSLFEEMKERGINADTVTFIAILSACRHCGLIELGERYFDAMTREHNITPETDHYSCMIDLYGRGNKLEKAVEFMEKIPIELDGVILGTFLNACKVNGNVELARKAEEKLLKIEGENGARYVQLANVYAGEGRWEDMGRIRKKMRGKEVKKFAGCSWVYVGNRVHAFVSADFSHEETEGIYGILACLSAEINEIRVSWRL